MANKIQIWNMALALIGEQSVQSASEQSANVDILNRVYDITRKALLEECPWDFAAKVVELAPTTQTPVDYAYEFALPSDMIYLVDVVYPSGTSATKEEYQVRQGKLVMDSSQVYVEYTQDITDTAKYSPLFVEALSFGLAMKIAPVRTESAAIQQNMANGYLTAVSKARGMNSSQGRKKTVIGTEFVDSRG